MQAVQTHDKHKLNRLTFPVIISSQVFQFYYFVLQITCGGFHLQLITFTLEIVFYKCLKGATACLHQSHPPTVICSHVLLKVQLITFLKELSNVYLLLIES